MVYALDPSQYSGGLGPAVHPDLRQDAPDGGPARWRPCSSATRSRTGWRATSRRWKSLVLLLVVVPFWTSFLIRTYAWLIILDPQGVRRPVPEERRAHRPARLIGELEGRRDRRWSTTTCRCSSCPSTRRSSGWTGRWSRRPPTSASSPFTAFREITLPLTLPGPDHRRAPGVHPDDRRVRDPDDARAGAVRVRRQRDRRPVRRLELAVRLGDVDGPDGLPERCS